MLTAYSISSSTLLAIIICVNLLSFASIGMPGIAGSSNQMVFAQGQNTDGGFIEMDTDSDGVIDEEDSCPTDPQNLCTTDQTISEGFSDTPAGSSSQEATQSPPVTPPITSPNTNTAPATSSGSSTIEGCTEQGLSRPLLKPCPTQGPKVKELQEILFALSFYETDDRQSVTTGFYGAMTEQAVMKFQQNQDELRKMKGEPPFPEMDGNTGPETWKALCTSLDSQLSGTMQLQNCDPASPTLTKCPFSPAVKVLQNELNNIPPPRTFDAGPEDGYYGPLTTAAVKKFQGANPPLVVDGIVGQQTWTKICTLLLQGNVAVEVGPATIEPETSVDIGPATIEPETSPTAPQDSTAPPEEGFTDEPFPSN